MAVRLPRIRDRPARRSRPPCRLRRGSAPTGRHRCRPRSTPIDPGARHDVLTADGRKGLDPLRCNGCLALFVVEGQVRTSEACTRRFPGQRGSARDRAVLWRRTERSLERRRGPLCASAVRSPVGSLGATNHPRPPGAVAFRPIIARPSTRPSGGGRPSDHGSHPAPYVALKFSTYEVAALTTILCEGPASGSPELNPPPWGTRYQ